ncbi:hypothetical protein KEM56_000258 [Ascosphaera pollenicola]|nr:hypothetical protein KEM56_000258 [Ascosphaera pollenicola]
MLQIGYGTGTAWYKRDPQSDINRTLVESLKTAIKVGYNHLDTAEVYNTERELGLAIKESGVPREQLFITTKVMRNIADIPNALNMSLEKLGLDYVDLYLIHAPYFAKSEEDLQKAWAAMEKMQEAGKARSIGVSNFLQKDLEAVLKTAKVVPAANQIEYNPYLQHGDLVPFMQKHGIRPEAYAPLAPIIRVKDGGPLDSVLPPLAEKYGVTSGDVLLRWSIERGVVPVTTTSKESRMQEYARAATFTLTPEEVQKITEEGSKKHHRSFWNDKFAPDDRS